MTNPIEELKEKIATMQHNLKVLEQLEAQKTDVEKAYRDAYGHYPETSGFAMTDWDAISWEAFQKGYEEASKPKEFQPSPQHPEETAEGLRNAMIQAKKEGVFDEPQSKSMDEIMDKLVKKYRAQKLWNRVRNELGYSVDCCDEIVDLVEKWIPKEQISAGSQNVNTELLVDGFNDAIRKMKEMLR